MTTKKHSKYRVLTGKQCHTNSDYFALMLLFDVFQAENWYAVARMSKKEDSRGKKGYVLFSNHFTADTCCNFYTLVM